MGSSRQMAVAAASDSDSLAITRSGIVFDMSLDKWKWTDGVIRISLNFASLPPGIAHLKNG